MRIGLYFSGRVLEHGQLLHQLQVRQVVLIAAVAHLSALLHVIAVRTPFEVDWKILSIRREPILSSSPILNAWNIFHGGNKNRGL